MALGQFECTQPVSCAVSLSPCSSIKTIIKIRLYHDKKLFLYLQIYITDPTIFSKNSSISIFYLSGFSAVAIALGQYHTCVIVAGGGVKCWGYNGYGQLGIYNYNTQYSPVDVSLGSGINSDFSLS